MSKLILYCVNCGSPNHYVTDKPQFCQSCAQPFEDIKGPTDGTSKLVPVKGVGAGIEVDESHFESNLNELDIDVETWEEQGTSLGAIMAMNQDTKPPKKNTRKTKKPKRGSKKQFLNEWEKEAGSIRKRNE